MATSTLTSKHLYAALRLEVTFYDKRDGCSRAAAGTGFAVSSRDTEGGYLVTNRHVLDPAFADRNKSAWVLESVSVSRYRVPRGEQMAEAAATLELRELTPLISTADTALDLAVVRMRDTRVAGGELAGGFSMHDLVTLFDFRGGRVSVGQQVVMPGYPGDGQASAPRPLLVSGMVSTDPLVDAAYGAATYPGQVLCHSFSRMGMSGAPVLALLPGRPSFFQPDEPGDPEVRVIGVNCGHVRLDGGPSPLSLFVPSHRLLTLFKELGEPEADLLTAL